MESNRNLMRSFVRLMRPSQWIKNGFVLMPLIFSGRMFVPQEAFLAAGATIGFCLASSVTYIINDYMDRERDRIHPLKRDRPLASGAISPAIAFMFAGMLVLGILITSRCFGLSLSILWIFAAYTLLNLIYSWKLKNLVIIDSLSVAFGFLLRVFAGGVSVDVQLSSWLLLCTFSIATLLVLGKRRHEVISLGDEAFTHRAVLKSYSIGFIDQLLQTVTTSTFIFYCLYAVLGRSGDMRSDRMMISVPFVAYGIFRYIYLIYHMKMGGAPTDLLLKDYPLMASVTLWLICCISVIYL